MFESSDPLALPWTTTKRDLNRDALVFRQVRKKMAVVAKPILRMLEKFYGPEKDESTEEREIAESMEQADLSTVATAGPSRFRVGSAALKKRPSIENLTIKIKRSELAAIREHLRQPKMKKADIGRLILDYYMRSEGLS